MRPALAPGGALGSSLGKLGKMAVPWASAAVRISQDLQLDKLWMSPDRMPVLPDPSLPEGPSLLARQLGELRPFIRQLKKIKLKSDVHTGARLWSSAWFLECMRCAKDKTMEGSLVSADSPLPPIGNYNDEDLGFDLYLPERPLHECTTATIDRLKARMAAVALKQTIFHTGKGNYEKVLQLDAEMRECLQHSLQFKSSSTECKPAFSLVGFPADSS